VICAGQTFTYTSYGAQSYVWTASTPNYTTYSNGGIAVADPSLNSVFSVYGTSLGCNSALVTNSITVNPIPTASVNPINSSICKFTQGTLQASGSANSFTWFPVKDLNTNTGDKVLAGPLSDESFTVIGSALGCTNYAVANIKVLALPVPGAITSQQQYCVGDVISLTGSGGLSYEWQTPGHFMYAGSPATFVAVHAGFSGEYTVTTTDKNNCRGSSTFIIDLKTLPEGTLLGNKEGCAPFCSEFSFRALNNASVTSAWMVNGNPAGANNFNYCFVKSGDYTITGSYTDPLTTCRHQQSFIVHAYEKPHADFEWTPEKPVAGIDEVLLISNSIGKEQTAWSWYLEQDRSFKSKQQNTSYFFPNEGSYKIVYVVENKWSCSDTIIKLLTIEPDFVIYVPNAFTPNSDSRNESFKPSVRGITHYSLQVFNRWGERLFETEDPEQGWDGSYEGQLCKQDSYVWRIVLTTVAGEQKELRGNVVLLR
jgi:gliding motility-associated-like protein